MKRNFGLVAIVMISAAAMAQNNPSAQPPQPAPITTNAPVVSPISTNQASVVTKAAVGQQNLKIVYGSPAWNLDSTKPDSAFLFMRDKTSGKIVKILLDETEPDSSVFSGSFAISLGQGAVDPQVYIPPREMRNNDEAVKKFSQMLTAGTIVAKPLIVKAEASGLRTVDVYDTKEQVTKAQQAYEAEQKAKFEAENKPLAKTVMKDQEAEIARRQQQQEMINALALVAAQREAERVRLEQIERQKILERQRAEQSLNQKQREERKAQAMELATQAMAHYQVGEFRAAEEKFKQSVELDPSEKTYYFRYGVTLYRNEKFNESLVVLKLAPSESSTDLEKKYYMGLTHLRLKELDPALALMKEVGQNRGSEVAPSAAFYEGVIQFSKEEYELAKEPFERVIDTSKDPRLDEQAEEYLVRLANLIKMKKMMSKRWFLNGMIGTMYDSNVLYAPDSDTTSGVTKKGDARLIAIGDAEFRPVYSNTHELGAKLMGYYLMSAKDEVSRADPFLFSGSVPYNYKGTVFGKSAKAGFRPSTEVLYMDANEDGNREVVMQSVVLNMDVTFIMRKNWFANYALELRNDDSQTPDSVGVNNADSVKTSLRTTQTLLIDKTMREGVIGSLGYVMNQAKGEEKTYFRYDLGVTYMRPAYKDGTWNVGLSYYMIDYNQGQAGREDKNLAISTGLTKPVREWFSWNINGSYANNSSTKSIYTYDRYTVTANAIFNYSL